MDGQKPRRCSTRTDRSKRSELNHWKQTQSLIGKALPRTPARHFRFKINEKKGRSNTPGPSLSEQASKFPVESPTHPISE